MVAVGKNTQIVKNLEFSINGKSSENLDDLFAELFALVNLENSPENNVNIEKSALLVRPTACELISASIK